MSHPGHVAAARLSAPMRDALYWLLTGAHADRPDDRTLLALERRDLVDLARDPHLTRKGTTVCEHLWPNKDV